jgi:hypothetical protein
MPDELTLEALQEAIEASVRRDERASELADEFAKGARNTRRIIYVMMVLTVLQALAVTVCLFAVIGYGHGATGRSAKFETVLVCSANSEQTVAQDLQKLSENRDQLAIPATCQVPK